MKRLNIKESILTLGEIAESKVKPYFEQIDKIAFENSAKVLSAFQNHRVSDGHFAGTTGYGYDDRGRDALEEIYAEVFDAEDALVRIGFVNGTHAIATALYGVLKPGDTLLCATGLPYDTLIGAIGIYEKTPNSLAEYGVTTKVCEMVGGRVDLAGVVSACKAEKISAVFACDGDTDDSNDEILITYVVYDEDNTLVSFTQVNQTWNEMWDENYCELDVPSIPVEAGMYNVIIHFNGAEAGSQKFEITV